MSSRKDAREFIAALEAQGWFVSMTNGGHYRAFKTGCGPVYFSSSPSDWRSLHNARSLVRRAERQKEVACGNQ